MSSESKRWSAQPVYPSLKFSMRISTIYYQLLMTLQSSGNDLSFYLQFNISSTNTSPFIADCMMNVLQRKGHYPRDGRSNCSRQKWGNWNNFVLKNYVFNSRVFLLFFLQVYIILAKEWFKRRTSATLMNAHSIRSWSTWSQLTKRAVFVSCCMFSLHYACTPLIRKWKRRCFLHTIFIGLNSFF